MFSNWVRRFSDRTNALDFDPITLLVATISDEYGPQQASREEIDQHRVERSGAGVPRQRPGKREDLVAPEGQGDQQQSSCDGLPRYTLAVRCERSREVVFFSAPEEVLGLSDSSLAAEAALSLAEGMGFLFEEDSPYLSLQSHFHIVAAYR